MVRSSFTPSPPPPPPETIHTECMPSTTSPPTLSPSSPSPPPTPPTPPSPSYRGSGGARVRNFGMEVVTDRNCISPFWPVPVYRTPSTCQDRAQHLFVIYLLFIILFRRRSHPSKRTPSTCQDRAQHLFVIYLLFSILFIRRSHPSKRTTSTCQDIAQHLFAACRPGILSRVPLALCQKESHT
jgi:hypothetical protein